MKLNNFAKQAERFIVNNSPAILTAIGVTGTLTTAYLAGRATAVYMKELAEEGFYDRDYKFDRSPKEHLEKAWKLYVPAAGTALLTVAAIVCANRISTKRAAALAVAYSLSERAIEEYKAKVIDTIGEKKERALRDEIAQERINNDPVTKREVIIAGKGDVLCYDSYTGRYFTSDMETLRKAQNDINEQILNDHCASLSEFYDRIGLPPTKVSEEVGWNLDQLLKLDITAGMSDDNRPCLIITFEVSAARNYFRCL